MRAIAVPALLVSLIVSTCSSTTSTEPRPALDSSASAVLQTRAFMRAGQDAICAKAPIYAPDSTPDTLRVAPAQFTDEIQYLTPSQVEERYSAEGRFEDGATLTGVESMRSTGGANVQGVDVSISHGRHDFVGRTYLFRWDETRWVDTSPDAVDVTVTSSVS